MKNFLVTIVIVLVLEAAAALWIIYSGRTDVGMSRHLAAFDWALDQGMTRSVQYHAKGITAPMLSDSAMVRDGFAHYDEMCVACHGAPGVEPDEIAKGLWPAAPHLVRTVKDWTPSQLFWITKNGVAFTAMPAWGPTHGDDKIWSIVAFLEKLPALSPAEYEAMRRTAHAAGEN